MNQSASVSKNENAGLCSNLDRSMRVLIWGASDRSTILPSSYVVDAQLHNWSTDSAAVYEGNCKFRPSVHTQFLKDTVQLGFDCANAAAMSSGDLAIGLSFGAEDCDLTLTWSEDCKGGRYGLAGNFEEPAAASPDLEAYDETWIGQR